MDIDKYLVTEVYGQVPLPYDKEEIKLLQSSFKGDFNNYIESLH